MKYEKQKSMQWVQPRMEGYRMACCDCALVHKMNFRIGVGKNSRGQMVLAVQFQAARDTKETKWLRKRERIRIRLGAARGEGA
jgi:hypothetical protein